MINQQGANAAANAPGNRGGLSKEEQANKFIVDVKASMTKGTFSKDRTKSFVARNDQTLQKNGGDNPIVYPPDAEVGQSSVPLAPEKQMTENKNKLFDVGCSGCMGEFSEGEPLITTQCKHSFHEQCINQWIEKKVQNKTNSIPIGNNQESNTYNLLCEDGPICPNCNMQLI